jgi:hypothetical protein
MMELRVDRNLLMSNLTILKLMRSHQNPCRTRCKLIRVDVNLSQYDFTKLCFKSFHLGFFEDYIALKGFQDF